jgi:CHAT domain-containing protein
VTDVLDRLVQPLFGVFRTGRLPLDQWWSAEAHFALLMPWYARHRILAIGREATKEELLNVWRLSHTSCDHILREADLPVPRIPPLLLAPIAGSALADIWSDPKVQSALTDEFSRFPSRILIHDELLEAVTAVARLRVITGQRLAFVDVIPEPETLHAPLNDAVMSFSGYELSLIRELSDDEHLLIASVNARRKVHFMSSAGVNAVADDRLGELKVPEWLTEYIVSAGGRIGHRACGPISYWFVALEGADEPDEIASGATMEGIELATGDPHSGIAEFVLPFNVRGESRHASFHFADSLADAMELALIAVRGAIRIDVFHLGADGLLQLISSAEYAVADSPLSAVARGAALQVLRRFPGDPDALLNAWFQEHAEEKPINGFLASDWAKAEELAGLHSTDHAPEAGSEALAELAAARDRWLSLEDILASRRLESVGHAPLEHDVAQARADYLRARGNVSGRPRDESQHLRLDSLVAGLVDKDHAFVHLNRTSDYLDAFICTASSSGPIAARLDASGTPLDEVETALADWQEGEASSLSNVMNAMGPDLGQAINEHLAGSSVSHVIISPVSVLHAVPMCLLEIGHGQVLGDVFAISYAPSARVLQGISNRKPAGAQRLVAVAYHEEDDIPLTSAEIELVGACYQDPESLTGDNATPTAFLHSTRVGTVLHAACHGTWRLGDAYASGLHLAPGLGESGYLSVARLHRDADLRGLELVVLSACDTGRSSSSWPSLQDYLGIDGAFLACGARTVVSSLWEVDDLAGLLFSVELHRRLVSGTGIQTAFADATEFLRSGHYARLTMNSPQTQHLDTHWPQWRDHVTEVGAEFTDPYYWAVFKLSGLLR